MLKLLAFLTLILTNLSFAQGDKYVELSAETFTSEQQNFLVLSMTNEKDWHTYWKNPGDAGLTINFEFYHNSQKVKLEDLNWPTPKKYIEQGNILAYGYSDTNHFFFKLPNKFKNSEVKIKSTWLVCKDICIPGQKEISISIDNNLNGSSGKKFNQKVFQTALNSLPQKSEIPKNFEIYLTKAKEDNKLALQYTLTNFDINKFNKKSNLLTPYLASPFDYKHEELFYDVKNKTLYGRIYIDWDGIYEEPEWLLPEDGVLQKPIKASYLLQFDKSTPAKLINYEFIQFSMTGDESLSEFFKSLVPIDKLKLESESKINLLDGLLNYLLFAFLGGVILNLMPCVLPVISLKLFGLIVHSDEPKRKILTHNLFYTLGVLVSFWALAAVILLLKISGEQVGWGFQLQSPVFVFVMLVILFIMSLNMLGLFEFITPGGKSLGNVQMKRGVFADFVSGILATVLSTPCSAPFLGTALTFAFTTTSINIFLIFTFVGLGLAFPFILTGIFPSLVSFFPKPGAWMEKLKNVLGFSLLLTFVWLYDVLFGIVSSINAIYFNILWVSIFFAFYFRKRISKKIHWNILVFILPVILTTTIFNNQMLKVSEAKTSDTQTIKGLKWNAWSKKSMQDLVQKKKWVFMDFTASWCLTCKVNKKLILNTDGFSNLVKKYNIELLVGDWTKRDENITQFLREYNIVGVPAYFLQSPEGKIFSLGETISISKIEKYLE